MHDCTTPDTTEQARTRDDAAELLRAEYTDALFSGDPLTLVSTPGLAVECMTLLALAHAFADAQAELLARMGAL
jgi:hypothetical protein